MTRYSNSFDGGTTSVAISPANSGGGSGTAFDGVNATGAATVLYDNTHSAHGSLAAEFSPASDGLAFVYWNLTAANRVAAHIYMYVTKNEQLGRILWFGVNGSTRIASLTVNPSGTVRIEDQTGSAGIHDTTATLTPNAWTRLEIDVTVGTTTSNGVINFAMYAGDSTTPTDTFTTSTANLGTTTIGRVQTGAYTSVTASPFWIDDFAVDNAPTGFIGPVSNTPPTVTLPASQDVAASGAVSVTATANDPDGSIASYAWAVLADQSSNVPTLSGASTATVSFTAPAAGNLITLQCVVTDNGGETATATTEVRVPVSGNATTLPIDYGANSAWTLVGAASSKGAALADSDDTTGSQSATYTATQSEERHRLQPMSQRTSLSIKPRTVVTATGGTTTFRLYEGDTLRQEWPLSQSTTPADQVCDVTSPNAITDWGNLWVAWVVTN